MVKCSVFYRAHDGKEWFIAACAIDWREAVELASALEQGGCVTFVEPL